MFGLTPEEVRVLRGLSTPIKIQNFLDTLPINFEKKGETYYSPRRVLRERECHCMEGALVAAAALWIKGEPPMIMDLKADGDDDHVVALYRRAGRWGAISKTNHATVRFRDPIYRSPRELAVSYFHEYFLNDTGKKVLREYSRPMNLARFGSAWITAEEHLFWLAEALDRSPHYALAPKENLRYLRPADRMERKAGSILEWRPKGKL